MDIAERIKKLRKELMLSQKEFARLIKVSSATVASWEIKRRNPQIRHILCLGKAFGCSYNILIEFIINFSLDSLNKKTKD